MSLQESDQQYFRGVYQQLMQTGTGGIRAVLAAAIPAGSVEVQELRALSRRSATPGPVKGDEIHFRRSQSLYALSRISDYLLEVGSPGEVEPDGAIGRIAIATNLGHHRRWLEELGFQPFYNDRAFSPFHHEIVVVTEDNNATDVTVEAVLWPGMKLDDLLFTRAGVHVRSPRSLIDRKTATSSTFWFSHRRQPRKSQDRATGWGSNSQWRTPMALFYEDDEGLHFNWEGKFDIAAGDLSVGDVQLSGENAAAVSSLDERIEVLLHRCFVRPSSPMAEPIPMPYEDRMSLRSNPASSWPLPDGAIIQSP